MWRDWPILVFFLFDHGPVYENQIREMLSKMQISLYLLLFSAAFFPGCMPIKLNDLDSSHAPGLMISTMLSQTQPSFALFTNTNILLLTKGNGSYSARTMNGVTAVDRAAAMGKTVFAVAFTDVDTVHLSFDGGMNWANSGITGLASGTKTIAGCGTGFSVTGTSGTNLTTAFSTGDTNWTSTSQTFTVPAVYSAGCHGSKFLISYSPSAAPLAGTVAVSQDGVNYVSTAVGGTSVPLALASDGTKILAVDSNPFYYTSTDGGTSYSAASLISGYSSPWRSVGFLKNRFVGAFYDGSSTCAILEFNGTSWAAIPGAAFSCPVAPTFNSIFVNGSNAIISGQLSGAPVVYRTNDGGSTWLSDTINEPGVTNITSVVLLPD